ncbi:hypothetical protein [Holdemanella porci]|nr:hypothetical protein [Holdemanella porci]
MNNGLSAIDYYTTALAPCRKSLIYFSGFSLLSNLCVNVKSMAA